VAKLFGTDGVRGVAGADLTAELARSIAVASVGVLAGHEDRPLVVVGRDPRQSGEWLQAAVVDGLLGVGADVALLGVIPTPAVARAVADGVPGVEQVPSFGIVISASHNPAPDNGMKLFGASGVKLSDDDEAAIEARVDDLAIVPAQNPGRVRADLTGDVEWYVQALLATVSQPLGGLRVVVDCANGAASVVAESVYARAGADVVAINTQVSGEHINDGCGAMHLKAVRAAVAAHGADVGIAHDGDADRCLAVTASGHDLDGDEIVAILALDLQRRGRLQKDTVAVTVMSNLGLIKALHAHGIGVTTTPVGDRQVADRMRTDGLVLGGEQSGHIVLFDYASTGDGVLTALHLLAAVASSGRSIESLASVVERLPQVLVNVTVRDRDDALDAIGEVVADAEAELGDDGRVLVRASGTEPVVRVMVEAPTDTQANELATRIAAVLS
jgi:phosphoglucosamine mutase